MLLGDEMIRPRMGIIGIMLAVAMFAINLTVMKSWVPVQYLDLSRLLYATGILPTSSVLLFAAVLAIRELASRGTVSPFLVGFLSAGCPAVFVFVSAASIAPQWVSDVGQGFFLFTLPFLRNQFELSPIQTWAMAVCSLLSILFSIPQLIVAILGGWIATKLGLTIRLSPRTERTIGADAVPS